jgi:hypothetical protein
MTTKISTANNTRTETVRNCVTFLIDYFHGLTKNPLTMDKAKGSILKLHEINKNLDFIEATRVSSKDT